MSSGPSSLLLVEPNVHLALAVSGYAYLLGDGHIVLEGPSRPVARDQHVRKTYLGI